MSMSMSMSVSTPFEMATSLCVLEIDNACEPLISDSHRVTRKECAISTQTSHHHKGRIFTPALCILSDLVSFDAVRWSCLDETTPTSYYTHEVWADLIMKTATIGNEHSLSEKISNCKLTALRAIEEGVIPAMDAYFICQWFANRKLSAWSLVGFEPFYQVSQFSALKVAHRTEIQDVIRMAVHRKDGEFIIFAMHALHSVDSKNYRTLKEIISSFPSFWRIGREEDGNGNVENEELIEIQLQDTQKLTSLKTKKPKGKDKFTLKDSLHDLLQENHKDHNSETIESFSSNQKCSDNIEICVADTESLTNVNAVDDKQTIITQSETIEQETLSEKEFQTFSPETQAEIKLPAIDDQQNNEDNNSNDNGKNCNTESVLLMGKNLEAHTVNLANDAHPIETQNVFDRIKLTLYDEENKTENSPLKKQKTRRTAASLKTTQTQEIGSDDIKSPFDMKKKSSRPIKRG